MATKIVADGNEAAAYVSYAFTEVANAPRPVPYGRTCYERAALGKKNIFDRLWMWVELQRKGERGGKNPRLPRRGHRTTTYTASQGLL